MIILGIDPGTASTGYGIIEHIEDKKRDRFKYLECGVIKTLPTESAPDRLWQINKELNKLIKKHRPEMFVMEKLYFFRNFKTVIPVSQAGGVILMTAAKNRMPIYQFTPLQIKAIVTGFGRAEKKEIQKKIKVLLKLKEAPKPDDAADALAAALAFCLKGKGA